MDWPIRVRSVLTAASIALFGVSPAFSQEDFSYALGDYSFSSPFSSDGFDNGTAPFAQPSPDAPQSGVASRYIFMETPDGYGFGVGGQGAPEPPWSGPGGQTNPNNGPLTTGSAGLILPY
jgi:hypothetical protein